MPALHSQVPETLVLRDRLVALFRARPGHAMCVRCAAARLGVAHKTAHEAALKVEARSGFRRAYATCSECGKLRIVLVASGGPVAVSGDEHP